MNKYWYSAAVIAVASLFYFHADIPKKTTEKAAADNAAKDSLCIKYIDVGQGDSEFIMLPDGKNILIDAGDNASGDKVVSEIKNASFTKIDYLIATHPHADHIGGMSDVIDSFDISEVYMPRCDYNTKTYLTLLEKIDEKGLKIKTVKNGISLPVSDGVSAEFLAPCSVSYDSANNYSAVLKLTYGQCKFIFSGDAESLSEKEMLNSEADLSADVLKIAHHGSNTSSLAEFLDEVNPSYAIISCGINNKYSHPSKETLDKLHKRNIKVFRTDKSGTITVYCDGKNITIEGEK